MRVLLLPGWGFSASVFGSLVDALGDDYEFDRAEMSPTSPGAELPDILVQQADSADVLIGWSLGGQLALRLALQHSGRTRRLVLLATTPCFTERRDWDSGMPESVFNGFRQLVMSDAAAGLQQFIRLNSGTRVNPETRTLLSDNTVEPHTDALTAGLDILEKTDLRNEMIILQTRVLILQARDDRLVPLQAGRWLSGQLPKAKLVEYDNGGHAFFLSQPARVAEVIRKWL